MMSRISRGKESEIRGSRVDLLKDVEVIAICKLRKRKREVKRDERTGGHCFEFQTISGHPSILARPVSLDRI